MDLKIERTHREGRLYIKNDLEIDFIIIKTLKQS